MKYLDDPRLLQLSETLSSNPGPESRVNARFEAYSIKQIAKERKMFNRMEEAYQSGQEELDERSFSPEMKEAGLSSVFGRLDVKESRKVHFLLVSTLNAAFPDNDFAALQPNHFMREPSAAVVLGHLMSNLIGTPGLDLSPIAHSPSNRSPSGFAGPSSLGAAPMSGSIGQQTLARVLNDVIELDECEVYSWLPEIEYDPHVEPEEDEEASSVEDDLEDDDDNDDYGGGDNSMDIDSDMPTWGGGMELDGIPEHPRKVGKGTRADPIDLRVDRSPHFGPIEGGYRQRKVGGLLWSANYFFYNRRQKRVLFITTWCRKRPQHHSPPDLGEAGSLPLPISSALSPPTLGARPIALPVPHRSARHHHNKLKAKKAAAATASSSLATGKSLVASTIPIRGMSVADGSAGGRLATSAPTASSAPSLTPSRPVASYAARMAQMNAGGFKPRNPNAPRMTAQSLIGAALASNARPPSATSAAPAAGTLAGASASSDADASRVRKERSESAAASASSRLGSAVPVPDATAKRVRV